MDELNDSILDFLDGTDEPERAAFIEACKRSIIEESINSAVSNNDEFPVSIKTKIKLKDEKLKDLNIQLVVHDADVCVSLGIIISQLNVVVFEIEKVELTANPTIERDEENGSVTVVFRDHDVIMLPTSNGLEISLWSTKDHFRCINNSFVPLSQVFLSGSIEVEIEDLNGDIRVDDIGYENGVFFNKLPNKSMTNDCKEVRFSYEGISYSVDSAIWISLSEEDLIQDLVYGQLSGAEFLRELENA